MWHQLFFLATKKTKDVCGFDLGGGGDGCCSFFWSNCIDVKERMSTRVLSVALE